MRRRLRSAVWAVLAVSGGGCLLVRLLEWRGLYLHPGPLNNWRAMSLLLPAFLLALFFLADGALLQRTKGSARWITGLAALAAEGLFLLCVLFGLSFSCLYARYIPFRSPDGARTVIVEEESWLLYGGGHFYAPAGPGLMRRLDASYRTDDGFRPFSTGTYSLTWEEDRLLVRYDSNIGGIWETCVVPLA